MAYKGFAAQPNAQELLTDKRFANDTICAGLWGKDCIALCVFSPSCSAVPSSSSNRSASWGVVDEEKVDNAWNFAGRLRNHRVSPSAADCLIATIAIKHHVTVIHCDANFEAMTPILPLQTLDWATYLHLP